MRYLVKSSKKMTQAAPTMNLTGPGPYENWWTEAVRPDYTVIADQTTESIRTIKPSARWVSGTGTTALMQGGSIEKDHIYYIRTEGSAENVSGSTNQWFWRYVIAGYSAELNNPNLNVIVKMTSTGSIGATGNKGYINANSVMHFKIEAFDLTEDFGAGNEPTDVTFCQNYYGSAYIPNGTHYEHIDYYAMNGRNKETEVIG